MCFFILLQKGFRFFKFFSVDTCCLCFFDSFYIFLMVLVLACPVVFWRFCPFSEWRVSRMW